MGPNQVAAALCHRAVTNTGDRGCRLFTGNAGGSRSSSRPTIGRGRPCCPFRQPRPGRARRSSTPGATSIFWTFAAHFLFSTTSIAFITPRPLWFAFASHASCNLTRCLMRATHSHQETQGSADSVSRCATGSAPSSTGGKRDPTCHARVGMRGINGAPELPLGGSSFHHPLALSCGRVPTRSLDRTLRPHVLEQPADVVLRAEVPSLSPDSASRETHGTGQAPLRRPAANQEPASPPRSAPARATGAVRVEGHVLHRSQNLSCPPARESAPGCPTRVSALTNLPSQLTMRDRLIIDGNVISAICANLRVSFISNFFQPANVTSSSTWRSGDVQPPGPRSSPSCKGLPGAVHRCWGPPGQ